MLCLQIALNKGFVIPAVQKRTFSYYRLKIKNEIDALNEINDVLNKDKEFFEFIDSMNLSVKQEDVIIPVNRETLLYSKQNYDFLNARKKIITINIERLKKEKKIMK